jgi:hypothetical protein
MGWVGAGCNVKSDEDALESDMHRLLGFLEAAPPVADQDTLERLLDDRLDPGSAPPDYRGLARLLTAAAAPAAPDELAGEQLAMATFAAMSQPHPPALSPRRTAVPGKVFTMKAAAAALVAVLSLGGVAAAASGLLPDQASPVADQAPATTAADAAAHGLGQAAAANMGGTAQAGAPDGQGGESAVGPDASGAARAGLCRAWQAGQDADHGRRMDAVAFQALVEAAGGADEVAGYCQDAAAGSSAGAHGQGQASPPSVLAPPTTVAPPSSGPPPDPGPPASTGPGGQGQGGPPTTHRLTHPVVVAADRPSTGRPAEPTAGGRMVEHHDIHPPPDDQPDVDKFAALADAPVAALGLSSSDADALEQALDVKTVRDPADNKYVRRAQAIVNLANEKDSR